MRELAELIGQAVPWIDREGPRAALVLSSRARLARNLSGTPFPHRIPADELCPLRRRVFEACAGVEGMEGARTLVMEDLGDLERRFLVERHLVSAEFLEFVLGRGLVLAPDSRAALLVHEEDHLRLQAFCAGFDPEGALARAQALLGGLETTLPFAFDPELGYLTSCPTNVGTGLRLSVLAHLPALVRTGDLQRVVQALARLRVTVRGFHGEGSGAAGSLFQISNSATLGRSEDEIAADLRRHVEELLAAEERARQALLEKDRVRLEDRVGRAWGTLRHARMLTTVEAFEGLGDLRLGTSLGMLPEIAPSTLNRLLMNVQGAHLQIAHGRAMDAAERDEARAALVRDQLREAVERKED